jgi:glycosyltransferase involved in cell wall biosynthesis
MQKISVAMCTYNGAEFLSKQLESIKQQSMPIHELVVCDDGSSDETLAILERFSKQVAFSVQVHSNPQNLGSSKNFEKCMALCEGDLIFLCDQDDVWMPEKVEKIVAYLAAHPEQEAVFSNATMIDQAGFPTGKTSFEQIEFTPEMQEKWNSEGAFDILLRGYVVTGATLAIKKSALNLVLPVPEIIPDLIHDGWIALILSAHNKIGFIHDTLIEYREHATQQVGLKGSQKHITLIDRFLRKRDAKINRIKNKQNDILKLTEHLLPLPINELYKQKLIRRKEFYTMRATLPSCRILRIYPVVKFAMNGEYQAQEGGKWWRPMLGDLFE